MAEFTKRIEALVRRVREQEEVDAAHRWFAVGDGPAGPIQRLTNDELLAFQRLLERVVRGEAAPELVTSEREDGRPILRAHLNPAEVEQLAREAEEEEGQPPSNAAVGAKDPWTV